MEVNVEGKRGIENDREEMDRQNREWHLLFYLKIAGFTREDVGYRALWKCRTPNPI